MECDRFMHEACLTDDCPYYGESVLYCNDCEFVEPDCHNCIYRDSAYCEKREG